MENNKKRHGNRAPSQGIPPCKPNTYKKVLKNKMLSDLFKIESFRKNIADAIEQNRYVELHKPFLKNMIIQFNKENPDWELEFLPW